MSVKWFKSNVVKREGEQTSHLSRWGLDLVVTRFRESFAEQRNQATLMHSAHFLWPVYPFK